MNPTHGGYGGTELRSQPSAEAPPAEPGEPVEEEEGAETGQSAAAKSPLLRALMHVKWATLLQKAGKYERATEHFRSSLELLPSARAHFGLGTCLGALRLRREAAEELRRAVQLCPSMVGAIINLAGVQLGLGDFAEAERLCREALRLEPDSREATMNLANALRNLGRRDEAVALVWEQILWHQTGRSSDAADVAIPVVQIDCSRWNESQERSSAAAAADAPPDAVLVCLKWGQRYDAAYVNRLCAAASRQLPSAPRCVCFTESPEGIDASIEVRELPEKFHLWWGKAYLFSEEAGLDGKRVLFLDLDQVIVGSLEPLASYRGPFALLRTDGIACELAEGGYNSSVRGEWSGMELGMTGGVVFSSGFD
ncbi:UDP-N-acetylglucosamine--peptide N-acetylglucosaminyltransferase 110 kDa subunit (O-GlcNAc transferase subunit p110) (O-linked N-acetylglucosamine transferase 110 kDa subunit) (OGT) [Durusdinium trenchii]|uniref:UDP-N-acetylglucosamine--peptide N-acetylglucosaminyltransferase 110 kDa subunit (O-GlcNAc transferase subunit p110) (O-linked N-acetylglucosamine transferase 110 kDa subunit) (OGT) n=1 Tax=Durusdinium trenchii TaxID=1381693 RepID=A0ABP0PN48_9DINO